MRAFLPAAARVGTLLGVREGGSLCGVLVAALPGTREWPPPSPSGALCLLLRQGPRVMRRWSEVSLALAAERPSLPHHYLGTLGVEPACQGRGLGRRLLAEWLRCVDADAGSAYVETDSRRAVALYRSAGFAATGELDIFGTRIWRMTRSASEGDGEAEAEAQRSLRGARRRA